MTRPVVSVTGVLIEIVLVRTSEWLHMQEELLAQRRVGERSENRFFRRAEQSICERSAGD